LLVAENVKVSYSLSFEQEKQDHATWFSTQNPNFCFFVSMMCQQNFTASNSNFQNDSPIQKSNFCCSFVYNNVISHSWSPLQSGGWAFKLRITCNKQVTFFMVTTSSFLSRYVSLRLSFWSLFQSTWRFCFSLQLQCCSRPWTSINRLKYLWIFFLEK
jgi:hypothetical protein